MLFTTNCRIFLVLLYVYLRVTKIKSHFNPFMDSEYFSIDWSGHESSVSRDELLVTDESSVYIVTTNNEKYRCSVPSIQQSTDKDEGMDNIHTFELDLLKPLFEQSSCTYRLETYWTYELCHGKHLRQYHEDKEIGKKTKVTEYYLGRYDMTTFWKDYKLDEEEHIKADENVKGSYKKKKVQGVEVPYHEVVYDKGTTCDLTGVPRRSAIQYVCQPDGRGEIYEIKETSSCEYDVVVLTSLLCSHPVYGPKKEVVNTIHCHALDESPLRPKGFDTFENPRERFNSKEFWDIPIANDDAELEFDDEDEGQKAESKPQPPPHDDSQKHKHLGEQTDKEIIQNFLTGDFCIYGGSGWWKFEFCYGRHVKQYHEERHGKVVILLGEWDTSQHLLWISNNPKKRPTAGGIHKSIHHFYSNGNICDVTGEPRVVEVKMTCVQKPDNRHAMSIYLVELQTCQYKLVVESTLLCSVIDQADADGLVPIPDQ